MMENGCDSLRFCQDLIITVVIIIIFIFVIVIILVTTVVIIVITSQTFCFWLILEGIF